MCPQCTQILILALVLVAMQVRIRAMAPNRCLFRSMADNPNTHAVPFKVVSFAPANSLFCETNSAAFDSRYRRRSNRPRRHFNEIEGQRVNGQTIDVS
jgi:hypothetical protein